MKTGIITISALAIAACAITAYCRATENETAPQQPQNRPTQPIKTVADGNKGKSLVVYFSVPETDGVDASSGASRLISNGLSLIHI